MFKNAAIPYLKCDLHGRLIVPRDADYGRARQVYNAMIDRYPRLIVRCAHRDGVSTAVRFARDHELPLAIRGRGDLRPVERQLTRHVEITRTTGARRRLRVDRDIRPARALTREGGTP